MKTEEQIKQNAEEYASELVVSKYHVPDWNDFYKAYIAGAHSRDEEIYDLKRDIEDLRKMVKMRSDAFECARKEIDRLSNPWISVEELPVEGQDVLICLWTGGVVRNDFMSIGDINHMKDNPELYRCWMPTPRPKGGEK